MEKQNSKFTSKILLSLNVVLVLLILVLFFAIYSKKRAPIAKNIDSKGISLQTQIENVDITAKSAYVYDVVAKKVLYRKNELKQLPLASLTKLMMAITAIDLLPKDADIEIRKEFLNEDGDSGLLANESWKLSDLLDFSLVVSSNDGARSIASVIGAMQLNSKDYDLGRKEFIRKMNEKAQKIGLSQSYFVNESGLDVGSTSGGYGTAVDVVNLLRYTLENEPEILEATRYRKLSIDSEDKAHTAKNTNKEVDDIPGLIASKTGYTDMAGGNLAVAFDASMGHPIIVVVLGSTQDGRFVDVQRLVNASLELMAK